MLVLHVVSFYHLLANIGGRGVHTNVALHPSELDQFPILVLLLVQLDHDLDVASDAAHALEALACPTAFRPCNLVDLWRFRHPIRQVAECSKALEEVLAVAREEGRFRDRLISSANLGRVGSRELKVGLGHPRDSSGAG